MQTIEEIIQQARRLSLEDRRRLIEELEALFDEESQTEGPSSDGPYARSLALAGTAHTDFTDVSADKWLTRSGTTVGKVCFRR